MAEVVLVHGAFNELWGPHELKSRWMPALRDGLWHHGLTLADDQMEVCFYGDLFRLDPTEEDGAFDRKRAGIAETLSELGGEDVVKALGQAASDAVFERTVDMVTIMAVHPELQDRILARFERVVGPDTKVVVAHSLGSVLAYRALHRHPEWKIDTFVTLGSPLGAPIVFGNLDPPPVDGIGRWPGGVGRWVNVAAVGDRAASVARLADRFEGGIEDHAVDNGHRAHAPEPYLNCPVTGAAVARALG